MEVVTCLLCGQAERRIRYQGHDRLHPVPGVFTLVECARCGFMYLSPRPDPSEITRYYPPEYGFYRMDPKADSAGFTHRMEQVNLRNRCETVLRYRSSGDLLDYGCGSGSFLGTMQTYPGWRVRGLEPFAPNVAKRAQELYGVTVDEGALEDAPYPEDSFDVVTLWEVLEHLPQPVEALRQIHALLRPGGLLVLSLPNRSSFLARIFGSAWIGLDVPRHFSVFSPAHLERAILAAGFCRPEIFSERGILGSAQAELLCALASLYMRIDGCKPSASRGRRLASSYFLSVTMQPLAVVTLFLLTLPYSFAARKLNRGSQMVAVARRR